MSLHLPPSTRFPWLRALAAGLALGVIGFTVTWADTANDDLEKNRQLLEKWRNDPAHLARLRQDLTTFVALSPERQQQLRKLDHDLHAEESVVQVRLWRVLERYSAWLERLPTEERQKIETGANGTERLRIVRDVKLRQWIDRLPRAVSERIKNAPKDQQVAEIAKVQHQERRRRREWDAAIQHWDDLLKGKAGLARLEEFSRDVQEFVNKTLMPLLSEDEKNNLKEVEGRWPMYPRTLVGYAERHPILSPGHRTPVRFDELPPEWRQRLNAVNKFPTPLIRKAEGRWPDYAIAVTKFAQNMKKNKPTKPLGPARAAEFPTPIREFFETRLEPSLTADEKTSLKNAEGHWPQYPELLLRLAREHDQIIPGMMLPIQRKMWDQFRPKQRVTDNGPAILDQTLRAFAESLTREEMSHLRLSPGDAASEERLREEWKRRHQREWQQIIKSDQQRQLGLPMAQ